MRPSPPPPRRRRHRIRTGLLVLVGVAVAILILLGVTALATAGIRGDLADGRSSLQRGRRALSSGELDPAGRSFSEAKATFERASAATQQGLAGVIGTLPIVGRNLDVARGVADAGAELATAGTDLVDAVHGLPSGLGSLAPQNGALPLAAIDTVSAGLASAAGHAATATRAIRATPDTLLVPQVSEARFLAERQVASAATSLRAADLLVRGLPSFAGADGPKRYFFVAESPAEQRGTGGIWGAYAIATAQDGRFTFSPFEPIESLPVVAPPDVPAPNEDYARNYDQYGGAGYWQDMNMTPDFPSAAKAALATWEVLHGERLDGVISADPFALQSLLSVTGPAKVPGLGITIDANDVVRFTTNEAYIRYQGSSGLRKAVLGRVAGTAFQRFLDLDQHGIGRLRAAANAAAGGHLQIYSTDPTFQRGLELAHADGSLLAADGDLLSVVVNSRSGSKVDFYAKRSIDYDVRLGGTGEAIATTTMTLENDAPTRRIPGHVTMPLIAGQPGDNVSLTTFSCVAPCGLVSATRDGKEIGMRAGSELGYPWFQDFSTVPAGTTRVLEVTTHERGVWQGTGAAGSYRLTILNQTTVKPTPYRVTIHAPAGTRITWTSEPMRLDGGTAVWEGTPESRTVLEVRFSAPIPLRWWRELLRPLQ
jgi:Protein of unknown function (DUF4012)